MINGQFCSLSLVLIRRFLRTISPFFVSRRKGRREGTIPLLLFFVFANFAIRTLDAYFTTFPQEQFQIEANTTAASSIAGDDKHCQASPYQRTTNYGHAAVQRFPRAFQRRTQGRGRKGRSTGENGWKEKGFFGWCCSL